MLASATDGANGSDAHLSSKDCIRLEEQHSAHNYHPLPIVFERASGAHVWDPEGRQYIDCLSAYSAVNQGHCHPKIVEALCKQAAKLTLSSRAFHTSALGPFSKLVTELTGYEMVLPMNTGAEAVETALKTARKWAYKIKGVEDNKARIFSVAENFHGRTIAVISMSTDPESRRGFGPFLDRVGPTFDDPKTGQKVTIRYNDVSALERALELYGKETAAFIVEPIQGEAGIIVPDDDYLEKCQALCKKHNVLFICDEIQTGLGRTGKLLCYQHNPNVKPDVVLLGKALSGGVYPVSAVLSSKDILLTIRPGEHGSTYGGNPLACAVATAALDVIVSEDLCARAERLGQLFRKGLDSLRGIGPNGGWITDVRGKGLFIAIQIDGKRGTKGRGAWDLCLLFKSKGLLAKPTHVHTIRLAPPLVIEEEDLHKALAIINESLEELDTLDVIPGGETDVSDGHGEGEIADT